MSIATNTIGVAHGAGPVMCGSASRLLVLAVRGYGIAAAKIARTMFESSANIAYLRKHPYEVDNFIDYHGQTTFACR